MALRRGFAAMREATEESKQRQEGSGGGNYPLRLSDGESTVLRFYGIFDGPKADTPTIYRNHYVKRLQGSQQYQNCGANTGQPCVYCDFVKSNPKTISTSDRALFFVENQKLIHKLDEKVRVLKHGAQKNKNGEYDSNAYKETKYVPCSRPAKPCRHCTNGVPREKDGFRWWELSAGHADSLVAKKEVIGMFCRSCCAVDDGNGTIVITQYRCGKKGCGKPVNFDPDSGALTAKCRACKNTLPPLEDIECSNCDNPVRCSIDDFAWLVTRVGGGTDTTYSFDFKLPPKPASDEDKAAAAERREKMDEEGQVKPKPTHEQARSLNVPDPFRGKDTKHGAVTDDDEDEPVGVEEEDTAATEEDFEDLFVKKPASSPGKKPLGKPIGKPLGKPATPGKPSFLKRGIR